MKDPELRSPAEWAKEARERRADAHGQNEGQCMNAWPLSVWDCEEIADRMDDLAEALRLLRDGFTDDGDEAAFQAYMERCDTLLAKYADKEG